MAGVIVSGQKGSSSMPHKRNPITGEKISGLAGSSGKCLAARDVPSGTARSAIRPRSVIFPRCVCARHARDKAQMVGTASCLPEKWKRISDTKGLYHSQRSSLSHRARARTKSRLRSRAACRDEDLAGRAILQETSSPSRDHLEDRPTNREALPRSITTWSTWRDLRKIGIDPVPRFSFAPAPLCNLLATRI